MVTPAGLSGLGRGYAQVWVRAGCAPAVAVRLAGAGFQALGTVLLVTHGPAEGNSPAAFHRTRYGQFDRRCFVALSVPGCGPSNQNRGTAAGRDGAYFGL